MTNPITADSFLDRTAKAPDDIDNYLVYADWLQQRNDPRGEFILLCHRAEESGDAPSRQLNDPAGDRDQYLQERGDQLLGNLHGPFLRGEIELSWRLGFVDRLRIKRRWPAPVLAHRSGEETGIAVIIELDVGPSVQCALDSRAKPAVRQEFL